MSIILSFRTEDETCALPDQLAETLDRNRTWVINEALATYLDLNKWQIEKIKEGMAATDAGHSLSHQEMKRFVAKLTPKSTARK
jgi:predicted transcriptional regulator